ncbi:hypothetical protein BTHER_09402 [Brochothrix thermosphacta DSM 20171 = FSL F6-1036]|nr:hypothetical protein BTHER_09402 [Brochothrix thermosphacta DSM 20171 = FSL F6-1036]
MKEEADAKAKAESESQAKAEELAKTEAEKERLAQEKAESEEKASSESEKQETKSYTVKAGDTLYNIALTHYGSGNADNQQLIRSANGISGNSIPVGTVLTIPPNN